MVIQRIKKIVKTIFIFLLCIIALGLALRIAVFTTHRQVFFEWTTLMDSLDANMPGKRNYYFPDYHMESVLEIYAVRDYIIYDEARDITYQELVKMFQPLVDEANENLDGNPAQLYIGHQAPKNIDRTLTWIKPFLFVSRLGKEKNQPDENRWYVIIYKKVRLPFYL